MIEPKINLNFTNRLLFNLNVVKLPDKAKKYYMPKQVNATSFILKYLYSSPLYLECRFLNFSFSKSLKLPNILLK